MIRGRRVTLPSGVLATVEDRPEGLRFTLDGMDAQLLVPDVLYLAAIIRGETLPMDHAVSGGLILHETEAWKGTPDGEKIGPASESPVLNKGGGADGWEDGCSDDVCAGRVPPPTVTKGGGAGKRGPRRKVCGQPCNTVALKEHPNCSGSCIWGEGHTPPDWHHCGLPVGADAPTLTKGGGPEFGRAQTDTICPRCGAGRGVPCRADCPARMHEWVSDGPGPFPQWHCRRCGANLQARNGRMIGPIEGPCPPTAAAPEVNKAGGPEPAK